MICSGAESGQEGANEYLRPNLFATYIDEAAT
jgi:hypothetical protein